MGSRSNASSSSGFSFGGGGGEEEKIYFVGETMPAMQSGTSAGAVYGSRASTSSSASPSKRPVPGNNASSSQGPGQQPIGRCQVEGCGVDLSGAKAYYCKHRVCGPHSKAPRVVVGGIEQRFCQQCSRFHLLSEFDQGKRSCRRRLAGHNERRRKPPSGPLSHARQFSPFFHEVDAAGSSGFVMDFTRPSTTVPFVSNQPRQVIPNRPHIGSQPFGRTPTNHQLLPNPNETLNLVGAPNSSSARSLLSSPVQWGRPTTGDSFQDPFNFTHLHAGTSNSPGSHGYNTSASLVHAEHHVGLDMMERPVTETVQYSGQLGSGSALHGNRGSMNDHNDRNYEHGDGGSSHDLIQWSL